MKPIADSVRFFYNESGYSYNPKTETREQGRMRGAKALAKAEAHAKDVGYIFEWGYDDVDSSEWSDETPPYAQWICIVRDANGEVLASLGGIDFGRDGEPWGDPYKRVVEAELASEAIDASIWQSIEDKRRDKIAAHIIKG